MEDIMSIKDLDPGKPLKKKHVKWWAETVIFAAHQGHSLDSMLHAYEIRRSEWDEYAKRHKEIQVALTDAVARARGKAFQDLHSSRYGTNPAMMKIYLANMLGWTDRTEGMEDEKPPPQVTVVVQPSANGKAGNGSETKCPFKWP